MTTKKCTGGCLCGSVSYELSGDPVKFYHCYCRRCRKATGTGHASLVIFENCQLDWTRGEELVKRYKLPEAERFGTCFCTGCGGHLPRYTPEDNRAVVPAGSLDGDPGIAPQARIFSGSKVDWSCSGDEIPEYEEYPTG